jgi:hypothetical protein
LNEDFLFFVQAGIKSIALHFGSSVLSASNRGMAH